MPLEEYRRKRDFAKTPEPAPAPSTGTGPSLVPSSLASLGVRRRFVVQRHRATRLHYDVRLEIDGVLVSWAVPKGPTLDPDARRMAIHVEDHPVDYFDFEGVIPPGQYGAGDVVVWDWGTWEPEAETPDPARAIEDGELKLRVSGEKLAGRFTIVRTSRRPGSAPSRAFEDDEGEQWLLIHKRDDRAVPGWDAEDHPASVRTGRTNDEVRAGAPPTRSGTPPTPHSAADLSAAREAPLPRYVEPMKATLAATPFRGEDWLFEVKWDGYRVEAVVAEGRVGLFTRNGNDAGAYFPGLLAPPAWIAARTAIVDGEVVALDEAGRPDFSLLQERLGGGSAGSSGGGGTGGGSTSGGSSSGAGSGGAGSRPAPLVYEAFDLLYLDGWSLLEVPLEERKRLLEAVLRPTARVRYASHVAAEGIAFFEAAAAQGLEGVVAKRRRSRYEPGRRSDAWLKLKVRPEQELVVCGWTPGEGSAVGLGALVVGVYEDDHLRFAGKVGSGFDARARRDLRERLEALVSDVPPFDPPPAAGYRGRWGGDLAGVRWVRPGLVIRAEMAGWSRDGHVRQAAFKGVDPGRNPLEVVRERAVGSPGSSAPVVEAAIRAAPPASPAPVADRPPASWTVTDVELAALDLRRAGGTWRIGDVDLRLTNLDKVLFPARDGSGEAPVTKRDLIAYFARIAPAMLPHLAGRPLNLQRFPDGVTRPGFWQKDIPGTAPAWLTKWHEAGFRERDDREANDHLVADRAATLCWLGNQAAFEIHAWTSTLHDPWSPTFALIDIDPGTATTWEQTLLLARLYRTALEHLGVRAYAKVTGSRGIQAWIPVERGRYTFAETSAWVEALSRAVGAAVPDLVSWVWSKSDRGGKARLDYTQNAPIKTLVAPYAVRPRPGAPVSAPIRWDELDDPALAPDRWTIRTILDRVTEAGDLFAPAQTDHQVLPKI